MTREKFVEANKITDIEKWKVCLHEAGHIAIAQKRCSNLYKPVARAAVFNDGCGCASTGAELTEFNYAVMAAAGKAAERLSRIFKPPEPPEQQESLSMNDTTELKPLPPDAVAITKQLRKNFHKLKSDSIVIAEFCIQFEPDNHQDWELRHRRILANARLDTWLVRLKIRDIAIALFLNSVYFDPGTPPPNQQSIHEIMTAN